MNLFYFSTQLGAGVKVTSAGEEDHNDQQAASTTSTHVVESTGLKYCFKVLVVEYF